jgi:hypothetical protein
MKTITSRSRNLWQLGLLLLVLSALPACTPLRPCGTFSFTGTIADTSSQNGINMNLSFDFDPGVCGSRCSCNPVCYIQIVRTVDMENFTYLYPSSEKQGRATANGWYIDRLEGKKWGYYGRNDDGTFASTLDPGSDTAPTVLFDAPMRPELEPWINIWWEAVSVPVCIQDGSGCQNELLGYYFWSWLVNNAGTVTGIIDAIAWEHLDQEVDQAVAQWNVQAPGLGKNTFPAFSRLDP